MPTTVCSILCAESAESNGRVKPVALVQGLLADEKQYTLLKLPESFLPALSQVCCV